MLSFGAETAEINKRSCLICFAAPIAHAIQKKNHLTIVAHKSKFIMNAVDNRSGIRAKKKIRRNINEN